MLKRIILFSLFCAMLAAPVASAQSDLGVPSYETQFPVNAYESINLGNFNILLHVPVRSKAGPVPLNFELTENVQTYALGMTTAGSANDFRLSSGYWNGFLFYQTSQIQCGGTQILYTFSAVGDGSGTRHPLPAGTSWSVCSPTSLDVMTLDNSGLELFIPTNANGGAAGTIVYTRNGISANFNFLNADGVSDGIGTLSDTHANHVAISNPPHTYMDALSSTPVLSYTGGSRTYGYTDGAGIARNVSYTIVSGTYLPDFNVTGCAQNRTGFAFTSPNTVTYPNGSTVQFTWKKTVAGNYDGRLDTVTIPTGGRFTHSYSGGTYGQGFWCDINSLSAATMTITDGTGTWTFARTIGGGTWPNRTTTTTASKPDGSKVVYTFIGELSPIPTSKVVKDTDGATVLDTWTYCYDSTIAACNTSLPTNHPGVVRLYHTVPGVATNAEVDTHYDTFGNVTEVDNFDFGPTLVGKTFTTYGSWNGSSCVSMVSAHIVNRPCLVYSTNAAGTTIAQSYFNYNTSTGDLLNQYDYTAAGVYLTSSNTYNSNGTAASHIGTDGVPITFGNAQCNNLFPDHAVTSVGTISITWDCNLAMPKTTTSLNGLVTTNTYDLMLRPAQVSDNGGQAALVYTYTSPTQFSKHMTFNGNASIADTTATLNSLGQLLSVQQRQSPSSSNYDTISFAYDTAGHRTSVSVPCTTTLGGTCATHATEATFDGSGRPKTQTVKTSTNGVLTYTYPAGDVKIVLSPAPAGENNKTVQIEYDGLGRLTRSCEVSSVLGGIGACGERTAATGYLTKYTLDPLGRATQISRNAQTGGTPVNSTFSYDFLSRPLSTTFPESGTKTFQYDTSHNDCTAGLAGHLNRTLDAVGNETCAAYDSMGRLSSVKYPAGPYASVTPTKKFQYDSNSQGGAHLLGRLSDAFTCTGTCSSKITDEQIGFDVYGRTTDVWQISPSLASYGYIHSTANYWDNGQLASLTGIPRDYTHTFTVDGKGRPYSYSNMTASNLVASVSYNSADNPTAVAETGFNADSYQYDPVTQKMTQYQFTTLNAQGALTTNTGTLTRNPNGTLQQLAIVDLANPADTQTCTSAHDDLVRITSYNCGPIFNESYSYDYAGNVTKSGSISFNPGYVTSTNRYASGSGYTYDADGNVLHDAKLSADYTWDAAGNLHTGGGHTFTYDALNHQIDREDHNLIMYSPIGSLGTESYNGGLSVVDVDIPLPGRGSLAIGTYPVGASVFQFRHYDFAGNVRAMSNYGGPGPTTTATFDFGPNGEQYYSSYSPECSFRPVFGWAQQNALCGMMDFGDGAQRVTVNTGRSITPPYVVDNSPF